MIDLAFFRSDPDWIQTNEPKLRPGHFFRMAAKISFLCLCPKQITDGCKNRATLEGNSSTRIR